MQPQMVNIYLFKAQIQKEHVAIDNNVPIHHRTAWRDLRMKDHDGDTITLTRAE